MREDKELVNFPHTRLCMCNNALTDLRSVRSWDIQLFKSDGRRAITSCFLNFNQLCFRLCCSSLSHTTLTYDVCFLLPTQLHIIALMVKIKPLTLLSAMGVNTSTVITENKTSSNHQLPISDLVDIWIRACRFNTFRKYCIKCAIKAEQLTLCGLPLERRQSALAKAIWSNRGCQL